MLILPDVKHLPTSCLIQLLSHHIHMYLVKKMQNN